MSAMDVVFLFLVAILVLVSTPVLAIWLFLRYKLQRLRMEEAIKEQKQTNQQLQELRSDYEHFLLGFDATLKRLETRISRLESRQSEDLPVQDSPRPAQSFSTTQEITDTSEIKINRPSCFYPQK